MNFFLTLRLPVEISDSDSEVPAYEDKNEINKMITDMYKKKLTINNNGSSSPKKDNNSQLTDPKPGINKRKYQSDEFNQLASKKTSYSRSSGADIIKSHVNFDSFSCDNEIKEVNLVNKNELHHFY